MKLGGRWGMDDYTIIVAWVSLKDLLAAAVEFSSTEIFVSLIIGVSGGRMGYEHLL